MNSKKITLAKQRFILRVKLENKKTHGYLLDMRTNYFSIFFIYSNPFSSIKDSIYPHFKHTDALTCEKFRNIAPAESGLKTTDGIPPVLIIFPLLIRLLPHFGHFFITMIINNRKQKLCFNIFGGLSKKSHDYFKKPIQLLCRKFCYNFTSYINNSSSVTFFLDDHIKMSTDFFPFIHISFPHIKSIVIRKRYISFILYYICFFIIVNCRRSLNYALGVNFD